MTRVQLLGVGVSARTVGWWIETRRLLVVHPGVYALEYPRPEPVARAAAAVLACGPGALLSHESAAALWGLRRWPDRPHVTVPTDRRRPSIAIHRSATLTRADIRRQKGIRVTSPARTVLDIAPRLDDPGLARAFNDGRLHCGLKPSHLKELLGRLPHHAGTVRCRALVEAPQAPTRSAFEDAFVVFVKRSGLPEPLVNTRVLGYEVDVLFDKERVIVELDGYEFHQGQGSFERDRDRDGALSAAGLLTVRITWSALNERGPAVARRLHETLRSRRSSPA